MDSGKKERYIELIGNLRQRKKATELILKIATFCQDDNGKVLKDGQVEGKVGALADTILIQQGEVGRVLGRGGENIRRIEEESGARLELDKSENRLDMRGPPDAVAKARDMVLSEIGKDGARGPGGGGGGDTGTPLVVWVQSKEAGRIIGKGGENLRNLIQSTGAEIKVARTDGSNDREGEREIKVFVGSYFPSHLWFGRCELA